MIEKHGNKLFLGDGNMPIRVERFADGSASLWYTEVSGIRFDPAEARILGGFITTRGHFDDE